MRCLLIAAVVFALPGCGHKQGTSHRVIVLGVDGMDPGFVERHQEALPNIAALRREGDFRRLETTIPPQSPVAWATFITGRDPGGHGVFDFVHRDPSTMQPFSSMAEVDEPANYLPIGPYRLPFSSGRVRLLRQGTAFWQLLDQRGIPATVIRIPNNFPPVPGNARSLAGMGVPDLQGTFGTFTLFTDDPLELSHTVSGGRIVKVRGNEGRFVLPIAGPPNT
ncbi:MAG TPA: alkaline phosphatase family protein, partial [Candidatus Sulfopaludibacter sp.]|nr:alkaline phosphatase family protein [Candidatus Sulfopaludibacter sp.]